MTASIGYLAMRIRSVHHRWPALTLAAVLGLSACGADDATDIGTSTGQSDGSGIVVEDPANLSPQDAAEQNTPLLETPENVRDVEVLSVSDGSITTLRDAVDGDRPVLLWFWAPH